jgi:hypothetical protein
LAETETVRRSELLHLTPRGYPAGDTNVKRNHSSPWCQAPVYASLGFFVQMTKVAERARHGGEARFVGSVARWHLACQAIYGKWEYYLLQQF